MAIRQLEKPDWVDSELARDPDYVPDLVDLYTKAHEFRRKNDILPAAGDKIRVELLNIDVQKDFCFSEGSLYVGGRSGTGAPDANVLLNDFMWKYLWLFSDIIDTEDSHVPNQVFFPTAHLRSDGEIVMPNTIITAAEYAEGIYTANEMIARELRITPQQLTNQWKYYCEQLEIPDPVTGEAKYNLMLWPFHCMLGSWGHALVGTLHAATAFHSFIRGAANIPEIKGLSPWTEHFSIFAPEVMTFYTGKPLPEVQKNVNLIQRLMEAHMVIIAGFADSHCVRESVNDFLREIVKADPSLAKKVYYMEDCSASVVIPGVVDFTDQAEAAIQKWQDAGMNVVKSTTPIEEWPGAAAILNA